MAAPILSLAASAWPQSTLLGRARRVAADGGDQAAIMAALAAEYPGQPSEAHYGNPAALAVMERIRDRQREQQRREAHNAWRASRGMPQLPSDTEAAAEPSEHDLAGITNGRDLLLLCRRHDIHIGWDEEGGALALSRPIACDGALAAAIARFRPSLIKLLAPKAVAP